MKKVSLLIAMIAFVCGNVFAQSLYFDFNDCPSGAKIAQTLGDPWTTWSNAPGGAEDGVFAEAGGSMAAHFTYGNDQVLKLGGIETGVFDLVFDAYVPNGKCGYFNVLHHFAGSGSTWAAQFYLCATNDGSSSTTIAEGHGTVHAGSNGTADIPCVWDQWMQYRVHIDMDQDWATLYWNIAGQPEQEICSWQWSLDSFGENTVGRTLDAMDFYPPSNGAEYYVDNIGIVDGHEDQLLLFEPFEEYTVGAKIAQAAVAAGHDWWTTWSNAPGGNEDGVIANFDNTKCGHLTYGNDQVLLLGDEENGNYDLEFDILVPQGKNGYFNILHHFAGSNSTWAMQCYLHLTNDGQNSTSAPGQGTIHAGSNATATLTNVVYDEWMHFRLNVDTDTDVANYYYTAPGEDEVLVCTWQWSLDSFGNNVVGRTLAAMNFFPPENAATSEYYLDNFSFKKIGGESAPVLAINPLEVEATLAEDEFTTISITIDNSGNSIGDWRGYIDFGEGVGGTATQMVNYDADPSDQQTSLVGWNIDEPTVIEVGAMYPATSYAGAVMGTYITKAQYYLGQSQGGTDIQPGTDLTLRIYAQGQGDLAAGEVLAEKTIPYNQIVFGDWNIVTFDEPVALTGYNFFVTAEFTQAVDGYAANFDGGTPVPYGDLYRQRGSGNFRQISDGGNVYGNTHIRVTCQGTPVPATWASIDKYYGSIMGGDSDVVTLSLNSIGLVEERYEATFVIKTNDEELAEVNIPIVLKYDETSVEENASQLASIYPNPATTSVTLQGENLSHVAIYNVAGQLVRLEKLSTANTTISMDVEAGVYFFSVYDVNGNNSVQRVVIVK